MAVPRRHRAKSHCDHGTGRRPCIRRARSDTALLSVSEYTAVVAAIPAGKPIFTPKVSTNFASAYSTVNNAGYERSMRLRSTGPVEHFWHASRFFPSRREIRAGAGVEVLIRRPARRHRPFCHSDVPSALSGKQENDAIRRGCGAGAIAMFYRGRLRQRNVVALGRQQHRWLRSCTAAAIVTLYCGAGRAVATPDRRGAVLRLAPRPGRNPGDSPSAAAVCAESSDYPRAAPARRALKPDACWLSKTTCAGTPTPNELTLARRTPLALPGTLHDERTLVQAQPGPGLV